MKVGEIGLIVDELVPSSPACRLQQVRSEPVAMQFTFDGSVLTLSADVRLRGNPLRVRAWRLPPRRSVIPDVAEFVIDQRSDEPGSADFVSVVARRIAAHGPTDRSPA